MTKQKPTYLWKSIKSGLRSGRGNMKWEIGKWYKVRGELKMCRNGFHASKRIIDAMGWIDIENLAKVEVKGDNLKDAKKQCWREMRVTKAWIWTKKDSEALAVYAVSLVIDIYEKEYPDDKRPRRAIQAAAARSVNWTAETTAGDEISNKCERWIRRRISKLEEIK